MSLDDTNLRSELEARLRFETLIADLSSKFVNVSAGEVNHEIEDAQGQVCECLGLDMSTLWQWTADAPRYLTMTHMYRPLGGLAPPERIDAQEMFPWSLQLLLAGQAVAVSSMETLPPEAARDQEIWRQYGIKSGLSFPLSAGGGKLMGALSFNTMRETHAWPEEIVKRLRLVAQIFANALVRKQADQALRESEARLSLAAEAAGAGLWSLDLHTNIFWITSKTRELFGLAPDEVLSFERFLHLVHPEDWPAIRQTVQKMVESKRECSVEYRAVHADGTAKWMSSRGRLQGGASGRSEYLMGVTIDITSRKDAEEAFREAQTTLNAIIESTTDLIWSVDPNSFGLMTFNRSLRDYFLQGRGIQLEPGMRPEDLFPPGEYVQRWRGFYQRALQKGPFMTEYEVFARDKMLRLSFNVLRQDGKVFGISTFGRDLSEQKKAEREMLELHSSLAHSGRVTLLGQLASALAHELSQPLGAILRNAEAAELMLQEPSPDLEELRAIVTDIRADDQRAGKVIERLRSLLKRRSLDLQPIELNAVIAEVLSLVQTDAASRRVKLGFSAAPELPSVQGDRVHLQQVLLNLLVNAMDAVAESASPERNIRVTAHLTDPGMIEIRVCDNGPGLPGRLPERVFEHFFTTKANGMGMGLPVSKTIIEAHKGRIWAENQPGGGGACFCFTLPIANGNRSETNNL
jgi:PAS domain S-box-containing protein